VPASDSRCLNRAYLGSLPPLTLRPVRLAFGSTSRGSMLGIAGLSAAHAAACDGPSWSHQLRRVGYSTSRRCLTLSSHHGQPCRSQQASGYQAGCPGPPADRPWFSCRVGGPRSSQRILVLGEHVSCPGNAAGRGTSAVLAWQQNGRFPAHSAQQDASVDSWLPNHLTGSGDSTPPVPSLACARADSIDGVSRPVQVTLASSRVTE
jgi:hypothetical protein